MTDERNANRAHVERANYNQPTPADAGAGAAGRVSPGEMPPGILGKPLNSSPHDGGRRQTDNASEPTRTAVHIGNASPGYTGISPAVARELYKAPPAFADRIRDHAQIFRTTTLPSC
jgi:hypothetical protein